MMNLKSGILFFFMLLANSHDCAIQADHPVRENLIGTTAVRTTGNLQENYWILDPSDDNTLDIKEQYSSPAGFQQPGILLCQNNNTGPVRILRLDPLFLDRPPPCPAVCS
jgi:hypothetical protein